MKIPSFADMIVMPPPPEPKKPRAKRGANPKTKGRPPGPVKATLSDPLGAPPPMRNWRSGEYKPSLAMRQQLERAHAEQVPLRGLGGSMSGDLKEEAVTAPLRRSGRLVTAIIRSCEGKQRFCDEFAARGAGQIFQAERPVKLYVYPCSLCRGWHLTKRQQSRKNAVDYYQSHHTPTPR